MKRAQRIDGKVRIPLGVATVSDSIVPRPNAEIDDALGTPKAWRQAVSDPNAPSTFEALIMEMRAKWYLPTVQEYASKLAALAPHYVSKSKVRELLKEVASQRPVSKWKLVWLARALTDLLEEAGK